MVVVPEIVFVESQGSRGAKNLHFCGGKECLVSFVVKLANKPVIVMPNAN